MLPELAAVDSLCGRTLVSAAQQCATVELSAQQFAGDKPGTSTPAPAPGPVSAPSRRLDGLGTQLAAAAAFLGSLALTLDIVVLLLPSSVTAIILASASNGSCDGVSSSRAAAAAAAAGR
jgi:hypothetical protein